MLPSERREFVRTHRTCVFGYRRKVDGPAMSIVYYIPTDTDELLVSTIAGRGKARMVARDGKVSLCVLDERWPFAYLQVYADAVVETDPDLVVDVMMAVAGRMSGNPLPEEARPLVQQMAIDENRVLIRCRPYETFAQPRGTCTAMTKTSRSPTGYPALSRGTRPTQPRRWWDQSCTALATATHLVSQTGSGRLSRSSHIALCTMRTSTQARAGPRPIRLHRPTARTGGAPRPDVSGDLVPSVPQHRCDLVVRVTVKRFGVDHQPRLPVTGQHVGVVQVGMQQTIRNRPVDHQVATQRNGLLDQPPRNRGVARQSGQLCIPALKARRQRTQPRQRRHMDAAVQPGDDTAGFLVRDGGEVVVVQSFQEQPRRCGSALSKRTAPAPPHRRSARCSCSESSSGSRLSTWRPSRRGAYG